MIQSYKSVAVVAPTKGLKNGYFILFVAASINVVTNHLFSLAKQEPDINTHDT